MRGTNWSELEAKCPVDISSITSLAKEIKTILITIPTIEAEDSRVLLLKAKGKITEILSILISCFNDEKTLDKDADKIIFLMFQDNLGRLLFKLDETAEVVSNIRTKVPREALIAISAELESTLNSQIYFAIKKAVELVPKNKEDPKNKKKFLYCLWETTRSIAGVLGAITRSTSSSKGSLSTSSSAIPSYVPYFTKLLSEKGQIALEKKFKKEGGLVLPQELQLAEEGLEV